MQNIKILYMELASKYDPKEVESKWYQYWLDNKLFASKPDGRQPYTIVIPPPNVTGVLHICFYAKIAEEKEQFDMADVCNALTRKMITRHPHVYHPSQIEAENPKPLPYVPKEVNSEQGIVNSDSAKVTTVGQVLENWEQIKLKEKDGNESVLSGVPDALPSLIKAYRIQDKARNVGFDWEDRQDVWKKVHEELAELEVELNKEDKEKSTEELGDFLFSVINAARLYKLNPDNALEKTNRKFINRFNYIEAHSIKIGKPLKDMTLGEMDALWNEAKKVELSNH